MAQLHEILAVEKQLEANAKNMMRESIKSLGKEHLFNGTTRVLEHFSEEKKHLDTKEVSVVDTTVDENISYTADVVSKWLDSTLTKDLANTKAFADIVVDGVIIASAVPATFLLGLETKLISIREMYKSIHTLPPGKEWVEDPNEREGIFKMLDPEVTFKDEKEVKYDVVVEPTEHHPAQIRERMAVERVGKYTSHRKCGLLSPRELASRMERIEKLLDAVKRARVRANQVEITQEHIGQSIFEYINQN